MPHHPNDPDVLEQRKADHLALCGEESVEARRTQTLLDEVRLLHISLPELDVADIDMTTELAGAPLAIPLMMTGMTGGTARAHEINHILAAVAESRGMAIGLGSQRAMLRDASVARTFQVRDVAPTAVICGNIGAVQAAESTTQEVSDLVGTVDANILCVHLNPAQEIIQADGDRDFRGALAAIQRLCAELDVPVMVKETGCGLGPQTLRRLADVGVQYVDVSGLGGTTWVGVETLRASGVTRDVGQVLWDWGIPTAASIIYAERAGMKVVGSGGIRSGLDAAHAIALGADLVGAALPFLRAAMIGGERRVAAVVDRYIETLQAVMLLTGSPNLAALRRAPRMIGTELRRWSNVEV